ncbi:hypothetical protein MCEMIEM28_02178 [Burkholderiaceae bacterium]
MKKVLLSTVVVWGCVAGSAMAACPSDDRVVFSCVTQKAKLIEVCDLDQQISYSFGPVGKPELVLRVPRAQASTRQWEGIGRYMSYSVDIPNGKTTYSVFWAADRMDENADISAGVEVIINGKSAATVSCNPKKDIVQNIEGIKLRPTP